VQSRSSHLSRSSATSWNHELGPRRSCSASAAAAAHLNGRRRGHRGSQAASGYRAPRSSSAMRRRGLASRGRPSRQRGPGDSLSRPIAIRLPRSREDWRAPAIQLSAPPRDDPLTARPAETAPAPRRHAGSSSIAHTRSGPIPAPRPARERARRLMPRTSRCYAARHSRLTAAKVCVCLCGSAPITIIALVPPVGCH